MSEKVFCTQSKYSVNGAFIIIQYLGDQALLSQFDYSNFSLRQPTAEQICLADLPLVCVFKFTPVVVTAQCLFINFEYDHSICNPRSTSLVIALRNPHGNTYTS